MDLLSAILKPFVGKVITKFTKKHSRTLTGNRTLQRDVRRNNLMKKALIGTLLALSAILVVTLSVSAAPSVKKNKPGPFEGTFQGTVYGDNGSKAPITLNLRHRGEDVSGTVSLGSGLYIDGGFCGAGYVPASTQVASGKTLAKKPNELSAASKFKVSGVSVRLLLDGEISPDGEVIEAKAKVDLPWLCGGDPVITGALVGI
jgi:hypothetical protein